MSETATEAPATSNGSRPRPPARQPAITVTESGGAGPEAKTPLGTAPVIPLILVGVGAYLLWFMVHYWRQTGANVWPSAPIKRVLQGKGGIQLTAATKAPPSSAAVTAYEAGLGAQIAKQETAAAPATSSGGGGGGGGGSGGPPLPASASQAMVIRGILVGLGAPQTTANINSMAAWQRHEAPWNASPPDGAQYTHNPWNTTLAAGSIGVVPGTPGVRIYPNWATGIAATVATLRGYPCIVGKLKGGGGLCGLGCAGDFKTWSTGSPNGQGGYASVC